jgi:glycosyltransferase involved in cell wall biosynthesis
MTQEVLYVFGGEKAQGAEIVIERLMNYNVGNINAHLFISPGKFADNLTASNKPYKITLQKNLRKLNRSKTSKIMFYIKALVNYVTVPYAAYKYIKANNISIIHANTIVPASYLLPLIVFSKILLPGRKWLWSDHDMKYFSGLDHLLSKWCVWFYDRTLTVSSAVKEKYSANSKIVVLYNGLDMNIFKPNEQLRNSFRTKLNIDVSTKVFGIAASICPGKGQLPLIEALNKLSQLYPNTILLVAGSFADDDQYYNEQMRVAMASNPKIIHLGFVENMLAFYNGCDFIISNSDLKRSESLGTTIYEAMSCEKVVIASKTGGSPEIITDKVDGYLFDADNLPALQNALEYAFNNSSANDSIAVAARNKVAERFDIYGMTNNYNKILSDLFK